MKAMVLHGRHDMRCEEIPSPKLQENEVLVRVHSCSICGSDPHAYEGNHPRIVFPRIIGHEFAGVVEEAGRNVKNIRTGQRVCCDIDISCGKCGPCSEGRGNICEKLRTMGFDRDGAYAEYVAVPDYNVYSLPENVSFDEGSMIQTIGVGYHAVVDRARIKRGEAVAVIGAGPIGLGAASVAKARGATVTVIDLIDNRLVLASRLGVDHTINSGKEELASKASELTKSKGFDQVMECVGGRQEKTIEDALNIVKRGGRVTVVGTFSENRATIPMARFKDREYELIGSRGNFQAFAPCLELVAKGLVESKAFISHCLPLTRAEDGLKMMLGKKEGVVKIVLHP
jgi:threonine dehydrogenase-like Zn-dependent dehydrogenase